MRLENGDIFRLGKKLFKVIRIELESLESKKKFLKKAKKKTEYGKDRLVSNKLAYSETTRIKERTIPSKRSKLSDDKSVKDFKEDDKFFTIKTDNIQKEMLKKERGTQINTTNINNTDGSFDFEDNKLFLKKKFKQNTEVISKDDENFKIQIKNIKTELDETMKENKLNIKNIINLGVEEKDLQSISGSEIDLEGVYNAEQNEFIKVMVIIFFYY